MTSLPIKFLHPSDDVMEQIVSLLPGLPAHAEKILMKHRTRSQRRRSRKGSAAELRATLKLALDQDYASQLAEAKDVPYVFEYVIQDFTMDTGELTPPRGLMIATRLFAPRQAGSIYYGSTIYRVGDDLYLYWLSD